MAFRFTRGTYYERVGNYACAMTDRRILMAGQLTSGPNVKSINIENINDITLSSDVFSSTNLAYICIDTYKDTVYFQARSDVASNIYKCVHAAWDIIRENQKNTAAAAPAEPAPAPAEPATAPAAIPVEQLKALKELLDAGILTQDEFDRKKKELLGL